MLTDHTSVRSTGMQDLYAMNPCRLPKLGIKICFPGLPFFFFASDDLDYRLGWYLLCQQAPSQFSLCPSQARPPSSELPGTSGPLSGTRSSQTPSPTQKEIGTLPHPPGSCLFAHVRAVSLPEDCPSSLPGLCQAAWRWVLRWTPAYRRLSGGHFQEQHLCRQQDGAEEKMNYCEVATEDSADPMESSRAGMAHQRCPGGEPGSPSHRLVIEYKLVPGIGGGITLGKAAQHPPMS